MVVVSIPDSYHVSIDNFILTRNLEIASTVNCYRILLQNTYQIIRRTSRLMYLNITLNIIAVAMIGLLLFVSWPVFVNQHAYGYAYHGGNNFGYNLGFRGGPCGGGPFTTVAGLITCTLNAP